MKYHFKKYQIFMVSCLIISSLSHQITIHAQATEAQDYGSVVYYQKILASMFYSLIPNALYQKKQAEIIEARKSDKPIEPTKNEHNREKALEAIKDLTSQIFDPHDPKHILEHLKKMKHLTKHLDSVKDKKIINAINFLYDNHHRSSSSVVDTLFWINAVHKYELDRVIPMTDQVANKPKTEKLLILHKKLKDPVPALTS